MHARNIAWICNLFPEAVRTLQSGWHIWGPATFAQFCLEMMVISDPESNCNSTGTPLISVSTYLWLLFMLLTVNTFRGFAASPCTFWNLVWMRNRKSSPSYGRYCRSLGICGSCNRTGLKNAYYRMPNNGVFGVSELWTELGFFLWMLPFEKFSRTACDAAAPTEETDWRWERYPFSSLSYFCTPPPASPAWYPAFRRF